MYRLSRIAGITGTELLGREDHEVVHFLFDSRSTQAPENTLFVAIRSGRNDGHAYIPELVERGFKMFLVDNDFSRKGYDKEVSFLVAKDPVHCLQQLAAHHRGRFSIPVIGITGSNGKTVVKEWLYQLLKQDHKICRSPKSFNSQIGVPLSVLQLREFHTLAIFEAGISVPGEMEKIERIIRPTFGVLTSFGSAHSEGFTDQQQKLREKLLLFRESTYNIFNHVQPAPQDMPRGQTQVIGEAKSEWIYQSRANNITLKREKTEEHYELPFVDEASKRNAATCVLVMKQLGYDYEEIFSRLKKLQPVALRLEIKNGIGNSLLINDYYNSDLDSLQIALDHLKQQSRRKKKVVVLSDIEQSGLSEEELYARVAKQIRSHGIDLMIGIGEGISAHQGLFETTGIFYRSTHHFIHEFPAVQHRLADATLLLKGARSFGFETISRLLQQKSHDTVFEIDLNKLIANVNYYRSLLKPGVRMMCMVKAMGYGSGGPEIARCLQNIGVSYLAVAYADEGLELRESQISLPVMVMSPEQEAFEDIVRYQLEPEIYSMSVLEAFAARLDALGIAEPFHIHLKIDTGMRRLGFSEQEIPMLVSALKKFPQIRVRSVFSHLAASEDPSHDPFTREQLRLFHEACTSIEGAAGYPVLKHISNSAGITRFPEAHLDMVRLGIGMYGVGSSAREQGHLLPVGTLKTKISQLRHLKAGDTVGYGRKGKLERDTSIAVIPIGYADGFSRALGNGAHGVFIDSRFCPTVGNICMDMCMIDVTGVDCNEGDEAIIFSSYEQLIRLAKALNTIPYEVLTNVSARVKRVYTQE